MASREAGGDCRRALLGNSVQGRRKSEEPGRSRRRRCRAPPIRGGDRQRGPFDLDESRDRRTSTPTSMRKPMQERSRGPWVHTRAEDSPEVGERQRRMVREHERRRGRVEASSRMGARGQGPGETEEEEVQGEKRRGFDGRGLIGKKEKEKEKREEGRERQGYGQEGKEERVKRKRKSGSSEVLEGMLPRYRRRPRPKGKGILEAESQEEDEKEERGKFERWRRIVHRQLEFFKWRGPRRGGVPGRASREDGGPVRARAVDNGHYKSHAGAAVDRAGHHVEPGSLRSSPHLPPVLQGKPTEEVGRWGDERGSQLVLEPRPPVAWEGGRSHRHPVSTSQEPGTRGEWCLLGSSPTSGTSTSRERRVVIPGRDLFGGEGEPSGAESPEPKQRRTEGEERGQLFNLEGRWQRRAEREGERKGKERREGGAEKELLERGVRAEEMALLGSGEEDVTRDLLDRGGVGLSPMDKGRDGTSCGGVLQGETPGGGVQFSKFLSTEGREISSRTHQLPAGAGLALADRNNRSRTPLPGGLRAQCQPPWSTSRFAQLFIRSHPQN